MWRQDNIGLVLVVVRERLLLLLRRRGRQLRRRERRRREQEEGRQDDERDREFVRRGQVGRKEERDDRQQTRKVTQTSSFHLGGISETFHPFPKNGQMVTVVLEFDYCAIYLQVCSPRRPRGNCRRAPDRRRRRRGPLSRRRPTTRPRSGPRRGGGRRLRRRRALPRRRHRCRRRCRRPRKTQLKQTPTTDYKVWEKLLHAKLLIQ